MKKTPLLVLSLLSSALLAFTLTPRPALAAATVLPPPKLVIGKVLTLQPTLQVRVNGARYTVRTTGAELLDVNRKALKLSSVRIGHTVRIYGIVRNGTITAEVLRDIAVTIPTQPPLQNFISLGTPTSTAIIVIQQPILGMGTGNGLIAAIPNTPVTIPSPVLSPASPAPTATAIVPGSIVGVLCSYSYRGGIQLVKGTGIIVNPEGYVLTARHVVDPAWTRTAYDATLDAAQKDLYDNAVLQHCEVGLPENTSLPSADDIRANNPTALITRNFQYFAQPYYLPSQANLSAQEYQTADFAVLHITGPTPTCTFSNQDCAYNGNFPYAPVSTLLPKENSDQIISYGYPAETSLNSNGNQFYDFYLKGAVGVVGRYVSGSQRFNGQPMNFSFEAQDIQSGRSGSPLFWNGKLIGILYGSTVGSTQESYNLTISAIMAIMRDAGMDWILKTQ